MTDTPITAEALAELTRLEAEATAGPWFHRGPCADPAAPEPCQWQHYNEVCKSDGSDFIRLAQSIAGQHWAQDTRNFAFIAALRTHAKALIAAAEQVTELRLDLSDLERKRAMDQAAYQNAAFVAEARVASLETALLRIVQVTDIGSRAHFIAREALSSSAAANGTFVCKARQNGTAGGNDPADCDWPVCGCDPYADKVIAALEESGALASAPASPWQPMETAPKDGAKIDLLYPYPRGRTIDCFWREDRLHTGWGWRSPTWHAGDLLPEDSWSWGSYPNMEPLGWMMPPATPAQEPQP